MSLRELVTDGPSLRELKRSDISTEVRIQILMPAVGACNFVSRNGVDRGSFGVRVRLHLYQVDMLFAILAQDAERDRHAGHYRAGAWAGGISAWWPVGIQEHHFRKVGDASTSPLALPVPMIWAPLSSASFKVVKSSALIFSGTANRTNVSVETPNSTSSKYCSL